MCRIGWWFLSLGLMPVFGLAQPAWIADDMVAYYPFDGNVRDASGNGNDGINVGATLTENRFGQPSSAYYFDGSDDFIEVASTRAFTFSSKPFTVSMWLTSRNVVDGFVIAKFQQAEPNSFGIALREGGSVHSFVVDGTQMASSVISPGTALGGKWGMLTVSVDSSRMKIYVNGKLVSDGDAGGGGHDIINTSPLRIGALGQGSGNIQSHHGSIDDVRIYSRTLSAAEVEQLHDYEAQTLLSSTDVATARAEIVNGFIVGAEVLDGGYGYFSKPEVTISGGEGFGAVATATVSAGEVVGINIINPGFGYTGDPIINIAPPPVLSVAAQAPAEVVNGFVVGVNLTFGGEGYLEAPVIRFVGGNGSGAIAVAEVEEGKVIGIQVIAPGSGYTAIPTVTIGAPQTAPELSIRVTQVEVNMKVTVGRRYTVEASKNMSDWVQVSELFTAQEQFEAMRFDVDEVGQFFRVVEQR